ncbi:HAD-IA family hydrolase [Kitasatospora sp. NPDC091257]|uniref:HAD-IA family hydrolase n=1 Tax=unclassified Kitasatospora TaxID=2633591 RepID=UPI002F91303E
MPPAPPRCSSTTASTGSGWTSCCPSSSPSTTCRRASQPPTPISEAARRLGADPARCLAVDDADDGIAAALAAGMRCLTIRHGRLVTALSATINTAGGPRAAQP